METRSMGSSAFAEELAEETSDEPRIGRGTGSLLALVACALLAACSAGGDDAAPGADGGAGDDGGAAGDGDGDGGGEDEDDPRDQPGGGDAEPGPDPGEDDPTGPVGYDVDPPEEGEGFGLFELVLPDAEEFVLHGTLPVAKGLFPTADGSVPFAVLDYDLTPVPSQVEVVTWYPDQSDGADVVEVLALVHRDPTLSAGDRARYPVVLSHHDPPAVAPAPTLASLKATTHAVPPSVQGLLDAPGSVVVRATDCFGNVYEHRPLSASHSRLLRGGRAATQIVTYGTQMPAPPVSGAQGTLPHFFGVHAYVGTWSGESVLTFDLRISNGHVDQKSSTDADDALGKVYFESIEIVVPSGWLVRQAFDDPGFGDSYNEGGNTVFPIVKPLSGGKMNVMPWQGQFHRRLALAPAGKAADARALLEMQGLAFCVRGVEPTTGEDLYSWWNPGTARYFQQSALLPSLDHVGLQKMRDDLENDLAYLSGHKKNGTSEGDYPLEADHMGWAHPWGVAYGGMTGGNEIQFFEGVETACSASTEGYRYLQLVHRMQTDRQPFVAYEQSGLPTRVEDWFESSPVPHVPFDYFITAGGGDDPFGVKNAPSFQTQHVENTGKKPSFHNFLMSFDPHDFQHYSRYTRSPMALAWLGNDALSKEDLLTCAEMFRLSFHQFANGPGGALQGSGMKNKIQKVASSPGVGIGLGRGEGHGTACVNAVYAFAGPAWRADVLPWYQALVDLTSDAQSTCNGFLQSIVITKGLDGKYRVRQAIEQYIYENAMTGVLRNVLRDGVDPAREAMLADFLEKSHYASISELAWQAGHNQPWSWTAVAPLSGPPYCDKNDLPPDWHETTHQGHLLWSPFGYAYELTGDTVFFDFCQKASGKPGDALSNLTSDGLKNIENRAGILAVLQLANGVL